jgi:hypothetical protein
MPQNPRPPPWLKGDGPETEQSGRTLAGFSNDNRAPCPRERLDRLAQQLHDLGPRPLAEFLAEVAAGAPLIERLERYGELWALRDFIKANGGDRLPQPRLIRGRRA